MAPFRLWGQIPLPSNIESPFPHLYIENINSTSEGSYDRLYGSPSTVSGTDQTLCDLFPLPGQDLPRSTGWQIPDLVLFSEQEQGFVCIVLYFTVSV